MSASASASATSAPYPFFETLRPRPAKADAPTLLPAIGTAFGPSGLLGDGTRLGASAVLGQRDPSRRLGGAGPITPAAWPRRLAVKGGRLSRCASLFSGRGAFRRTTAALRPSMRISGHG